MKFKSEYLFATFVFLGLALFSVSALPIIMINRGIDLTVTIIASVLLLGISSLLAMVNYGFYNQAKKRDEKSNAYDDILKKRQQKK